MYPRFVQFETRRLELERELRLLRERHRARAAAKRRPALRQLRRRDARGAA